MHALGRYKSVVENNPQNCDVTLVMGPWSHGQWIIGRGRTSLGDVEFHARTEEYYRSQIELPFLIRHLHSRSYRQPLRVRFHTHIYIYIYIIHIIILNARM